MPRLSHWIDEAIAKLTEGVGASWQICVAASWVTPQTFTKFYCLDITGPPLAQGVITVSKKLYWRQLPVVPKKVRNSQYSGASTYEYPYI